MLRVLDLVVHGNKLYTDVETYQALTVINNLKHSKQQMCPVFELGLSRRESNRHISMFIRINAPSVH